MQKCDSLMYKFRVMCILLARGVVAGLGPIPSGMLPSDQPKHLPSSCVQNCICVGDSMNITVDCARRNLSYVPVGMGAFTTSLDLSHNNISQIRIDAFLELKFLHTLNLGYNQLSYLQDGLFSNFVHLQNLNIQHNNIHILQDDIFKPLGSLQELHLDANNLETISAGAFQGMKHLQLLWLNGSNINKIPMGALRSTAALEALTLANNQIVDIPNHAFEKLSNLSILLLFHNKIERVGEHAFSGLHSLTLLQLDRNMLSDVPSALAQLPELRELSLSNNRITYIPERIFANNKKLAILHMKNNPIQSFARDAFQHLPALESLILSEARQQSIFPDLTGNTNLTFLELDRGSISKVPDNFCLQVPSLRKFDIHSNQLTQVPKLNRCKHLQNLNLKNNKISSLEGQLFQNLTKLIDLTLSDNHIEKIPEGAFRGLSSLLYLDLQNNHISSIHPKAFVPLMKLEDLNLADNVFPELPTEGLQNVRQLKTYNNYQLQDFPARSNFPNVEKLTLSWAYHCCEYVADEEAGDEDENGAKEIVNILENFDEDWPNDTDEYMKNIGIFPWDMSKANLSSGLQAFAQDMWDDYPGLVEFKNLSLDYDPPVVIRKHAVCRPKPGPFWPCNDLMGWWFIRCGMWVVFLLALLGNSIVLLVSIVGRIKKDVPRFLICNLACADLLMGVYLGFLAVVDASSFGEFKKYAIKWQTSGWCQTAGFLGVLSSELSVYTLTVITMERYYAITHAVHINKRLSLKQAGYIMSCGWVASILLAILPLAGISDYRKFAVCLPFETAQAVSLGYVAFIMLMNIIAFFLIVGCYARMYWAIRGSSAWNSNDSRVAKRMAILIFTDFFCWAPISFFGLTAAFGHHLVQLEDAKIFTVFVLPLNSCANPFLYAILTKQFKKDCSALCKRFEESTIHRNLNRLSQRNTVTWGSSRRPSALNSFFDKRDSVSRQSVSGGSAQTVSRSNSIMNSIRALMGKANSTKKKRTCIHIRGEDLIEALGHNLVPNYNNNSAGDANVDDAPPVFDSAQDICHCSSNADLNERDFNSNSDSSTGGTCIAHFFRKNKAESRVSKHRDLAHSVSCPTSKEGTNDLSVLQLVPLKRSPGGARKQGTSECQCIKNHTRKPRQKLESNLSTGQESVKTNVTAETDLSYISNCLDNQDVTSFHNDSPKTVEGDHKMNGHPILMRRGDVHLKDKAKLLGLTEKDIELFVPKQCVDGESSEMVPLHHGFSGDDTCSGIELKGVPSVVSVDSHVVDPDKSNIQISDLDIDENFDTNETFHLNPDHRLMTMTPRPGMVGDVIKDFSDPSISENGSQGNSTKGNNNNKCDNSETSHSCEEMISTDVKIPEECGSTLNSHNSHSPLLNHQNNHNDHQKSATTSRCSSPLLESHQNTNNPPISQIAVTSSLLDSHGDSNLSTKHNQQSAQPTSDCSIPLLERKVMPTNQHSQLPSTTAEICGSYFSNNDNTTSLGGANGIITAKGSCNISAGNGCIKKSKSGGEKEEKMCLGKFTGKPAKGGTSIEDEKSSTETDQLLTE